MSNILQSAALYKTVKQQSYSRLLSPSINIRFLLITMFATLVFSLCKGEQYKEYMVANLLIMPLTLLNGN